MNSLILTTVNRLLIGLMLLFSLYLLLRGHNQPGGGFVGGLIAASAFALKAIADGSAAMRKLFHVEPRAVSLIGLGLALFAGFLAAIEGEPFLTGLWAVIGGLPLGTPLLFDVGVYLVVLGAVVALIGAVEEGG